VTQDDIVPGTNGPSWRTVDAPEVGLVGQAWNRAVEAAETGTLFHTMEWLQAMAQGFGRTLRAYAFLDGSGSVKALFPVVMGKVGPLRTAYSPISIVTPYGGPACAVGDFSRCLQAISRIARDQKWDYLSISFPPRASYELVPPRGFSIRAGSTCLVPLGPEKSMWDALESRCRRAIGKARSSGLTVRDVSGFDFLDDYISWGAAAHARYHEEYPVPRAFLEALRDMVLPSGALLARGVFAKEQAVAYWFFGIWRGSLFYLDSSMDRTAGASGAGSLVTWETMQLASQRGATQLDLLGTTIPAIALFKRSFGGQNAPAHGMERSTRRYRLARGLRNRVLRRFPR